MKTPKKKEVVKYFENAKEVESLAGTRFKFNPSEKIIERSGVFRYEPKGTSLILWNPKNGYAKILSYKEPKEKTYKIKQETGMDSITINDVKYIKEDKDSYKITREQVLSLKNTLIKEDSDELLKTIFPEVFETKLAVGKWYKSLKYQKQIIYVIQFNDVQHIRAYGFNIDGDWESCDDRFSWGLPTDGSYIEATEQEVEAALTKECERLGIREGAHIKDVVTGETVKIEGNYRYYANNSLKHLGHTLFHNGKFAEIIPTLTIQEAEAKLKELGVNAKIV